MQFVDDHGNDVLNLGSFTLLPQHVVNLILSREELKADEFSKFQVRSDCLHLFWTFYLKAALMWSKKHSWATMQPLLEARTLEKLFLTFEIYLQVIEPFLAYVKFHMIPAKLLMTEVHPLGLVPYS